MQHLLLTHMALGICYVLIQKGVEHLEQSTFDEGASTMGRTIHIAATLIGLTHMFTALSILCGVITV